MFNFLKRKSTIFLNLFYGSPFHMESQNMKYGISKKLTNEEIIEDAKKRIEQYNYVSISFIYRDKKLIWNGD